MLTEPPLGYHSGNWTANSVNGLGLLCSSNGSVVYFCFLRKVVRQNGTDLTSLRMQFVKIGLGLLREAFGSEGSVFLAKK